MSGKKPTKGRPVRFSPADAPKSPVGPKVIGLHFMIPTVTGQYELDYSEAGSRSIAIALASQLREDLIDDGHRRTREAVHQRVASVWTFLRYLTGSHFDGTVSDLRVEHLKGYLRSLFDGSSEATAKREFSALVAILRRIEYDCPTLDPLLQKYLSTATSQFQRSELQRRDSYSPYVVKQIVRAAQRDLLAIARRRTVSPHVEFQDEIAMRDALSAEIAAVGVVEARSKIFRTLYDYRWRRGRRTEGLWMEIHSEHHLLFDEVIPLLIMLSYESGLEIECCRYLKASCLSGKNPGRGNISYTKGRAKFKSFDLPVEDRSIRTPGGLIRAILSWTEHTRKILQSPFLFANFNGQGPQNAPRRPFRAVERWARRHELIDDHGRPLRLELSRIRKVAKQRDYIKAKGDIYGFSRNHSLQVRVMHYAEIEGLRDVHEATVEDAFDDIIDLASNSAGSEGGDDGSAAMDGWQDTWVATCEAPRASPFAPAGQLCSQSHWRCLECDNAVYSERKLPAILQMLSYVTSRREDLEDGEWLARFGWIFTRITTQILPQFTAGEIASAELVASVEEDLIYLPAEVAFS